MLSDPSYLFNYGNVINIHHLQLSHYLLHQVQVDHFHLTKGSDSIETKIMNKNKWGQRAILSREQFFLIY